VKEMEKGQATDMDPTSQVSRGGNAPAAGPTTVDGSSIGIELDELTLDVLLDEQLPVHSTAIVALSTLISRIDEMINIIELLCGEASFQGYELLQHDYLDREERAIGVGFADGRQ